MNDARFAIIVLAGLALIGLGLSVFTVNERELALKLQVGEVVRSEYEPGLHWKIPVFQTVEKMPRRILTIEDEPERIFTADRLALQVDYFVKYRIVDAVQFYTSTGNDAFIAESRLGELIKNAIVTEFGKRSVPEAVSVERAELMRDIMESARETALGLGIELIDVRVKQVEFPDDVRNAVYREMREERARIAAETRAEGEEIAEQLRAEANRQRTVILAEANRDAQVIRGEGDALAAEIYAGAYNADPDFYAFYRSIDAYRNSIRQSGDLIVLDPKNDFFRYLNNLDGNR